MELSPADTHTVLLAGLFVQATTTLILALLSWSDRRTAGTPWLAAGAALGVITVCLRLPHPVATRAVWDAPLATLSMLSEMFNYIGLRWFAIREPLPRRLWAGLAFGAIIVMLACEPVAPLVGLLFERMLASIIVLITVLMLWKTRFPQLRTTLRVTSVVMFAFLVVRIVIVLLHFGTMATVRLSLYERIASLALTVLLSFCFVALFVDEGKRRLEDETRIDVLTGLRNRRALEETADRLVRHASSSATSLWLLMLDIDHFKALNDAHGHSVGDQALRDVGRALLDTVGHSHSRDCIGRLGGEEFAILLSGVSAEAATGLAESIRVSIASLAISGSDTPLTVSIGVSQLKPGEHTWAHLLARADEALYTAKREGRNRVAVCLHTSHDSTPFTEDRRSAWRDIFTPRRPML